MNTEIKMRAYEMLMNKQNVESGINRVYVVGDKLFAFELPAIRYAKEVYDGRKRIEVVTVYDLQADGIMPGKRPRINQRGSLFDKSEVHIFQYGPNEDKTVRCWHKVKKTLAEAEKKNIRIDRIVCVVAEQPDKYPYIYKTGKLV